ncbi:MAG: CYTH and CHAD domain-containing protein [Mycobacteriaceae bacterium]
MNAVETTATNTVVARAADARATDRAAAPALFNAGAAERHRETERKFDAHPDTPLPDLTCIKGVVTFTEPVETTLEATYFDTTDLRLAARGITLRCRTGGLNPGWDLKVPVGDSERIEFRLPLEEAVGGVPEPLLREVRAIIRDRDLAPVAIVRTTRRERCLLDAVGNVLAEVADDTVHAQRLVGPAVELPRWREVEVELAHGDKALLDAVTARLESAGITRSRASSKLHRVLDELASRRQTPTLGKRATAGEAFLAYTCQQVDLLISWDPPARRDEPDAVHQMRVATRRLRSALATYRPLLMRDRTDPLRDELKWLGLMLGSARDAEVLRDRLRDLVAAQPPQLILGPVPDRIELEMGQRYTAARSHLLPTLDDARYLRLLDTLEDLVTHPAFAERAHRLAQREQPRLVARACRRVDRAAAAADVAHDDNERDRHLHEVRKAAKRARYAAESAAPVCGKPARRLAKRMEAVAEVLGNNQDSVIARDALLESATSAHAAGESAFTYGLMYAAECSRGLEAQHAYRAVLHTASSKKVRRWTQ